MGTRTIDAPGTRPVIAPAGEPPRPDVEALPAWLDQDAVEVIDVEVTEADIDQGRRCQPAWCMVAVALRRQLGVPDRRQYRWTRAWDERRVDARLWVGTGPDDGGRWRIRYLGTEYLMPREVGERIEGWDVGSASEPFRFRAVRIR